MKSTKDLVLILASICFVIILGAGLYEHVTEVPKWTIAPPSSLSMFQGVFGMHAENFWIPIHPITLFFLGGALIANWYTSRRKTILIVIGSYILILAITFGYFVPELMKIIQTPFQNTVDQELVHRASIWETLSLIRLCIIAILSVILLSSLTMSNERVVIVEVKDVPLSYNNDALGG